MVAAPCTFGAGVPTHENLEARFMMIRFAGCRAAAQDVAWRQTTGRRFTDSKDILMKWETPQAVDFRFGMEITMYIANR
jgi:coenzyme PQQ precursor peptide PqqA